MSLIITPQIVQRFWPKVVMLPTGCWEWTARRDDHGYGFLALGGGRVMACHRIAYCIYYQKDPTGLVIRHRCDNPPCCNPLHLLSGTQAQNIQDMVLRNRNQRGEDHHRHRLTEGQVHEIKARPRYLGEGKHLAEEFEVSGATISLILNNKIWKHVHNANEHTSQSTSQRL